jgi:hypothetical protein
MDTKLIFLGPLLPRIYVSWREQSPVPGTPGRGVRDGRLLLSWSSPKWVSSWTLGLSQLHFKPHCLPLLIQTNFKPHFLNLASYLDTTSRLFFMILRVFHHVAQTLVPQKIKCLEINLTKEVQNLYLKTTACCRKKEDRGYGPSSRQPA